MFNPVVVMCPGVIFFFLMFLPQSLFLLLDSSSRYLTMCDIVSEATKTLLGYNTYFSLFQNMFKKIFFFKFTYFSSALSVLLFSASVDFSFQILWSSALEFALLQLPFL